MITIEELQKEGFEIRGHSFLPNVSLIIDLCASLGAKEIRLYQETELENGKNPSEWYLFMRK